MSELSDTGARQTALEPARSFIVQAPAGSGKTELLIQRFLRLLTTVNYPEQIVAVTFTRKAAAEMRARVIEMLEAAANSSPVAAHKQKTLALAHEALKRDSELEWLLLERPARLRIETVDALNGRLAERLPVSAGGMGAANVIAQPAGVYRHAAETAI